MVVCDTSPLLILVSGVTLFAERGAVALDQTSYSCYFSRADVHF